MCNSCKGIGCCVSTKLALNAKILLLYCQYIIHILGMAVEAHSTPNLPMYYRKGGTDLTSLFSTLGYIIYFSLYLPILSWLLAPTILELLLHCDGYHHTNRTQLATEGMQGQTQSWCIWIVPSSGKNHLVTVKSGLLYCVTLYIPCHGRESFLFLTLSSCKNLTSIAIILMFVILLSLLDGCSS